MYRHHSLELKLRAVELYAQGYGRDHIGRELGVYPRLVGRWIERHKQLGISGLKKQIKAHPIPAFKECIVREVLEKFLSYESAAIKYGVSETAIHRWVNQVKTHGYVSLSQIKPRGRAPKIMGRPKKQEPQTELEELQERVKRLEAENALLKKVHALVEEKEARLREIGREPSKD